MCIKPESRTLSSQLMPCTMKVLLLAMVVAVEAAARNEIDPACKSTIDGTGDRGDQDYWNKGLDCSGKQVYDNVQGTGYYPSHDGVEGGCIDMRGIPLRTLQDYLNGRANYVSVAMDQAISGSNYGRDICIPQMNHRYGKRIRFKVVDHGPSFDGQGGKKIDICVRTEQDSFDGTINNKLTIHLL